MIEASVFIEAMRELGLPVFAYSGRGMYGARCVATKTSRDEALTEFGIGMALGAWAQQNGHVLDIPEPSTDSLGFDMVLYWRDIAWPDGMKDEDE